MNIEHKKKEEYVEFGELCICDVFEHNGKYFMKISCNDIERVLGSNAIDLNDNETAMIGKDVVVCRVNAKVVIE